MAITSSVSAKRNQDAICSRMRPKTTDDNDGDSTPWPYLIPDILVSVISRLGVIDFVAFSCVCKSWRTVALSYRKTFMLSREPMNLRFSTEVAKISECYLEDLEGRKFKTFLPNISSDTICIGSVSGYLILFGRETRDFRLVNLITRHEIHFPSLPSHMDPDRETFRCALVFSPTMSTWAFVSSFRFSMRVSFCFSSEGAKWTNLDFKFYFIDLHFFKGKIYTLNLDTYLECLCLCELTLNPTPSLTLLKMKNPMDPEPGCPKFATWGEKLHIVGLHKGWYVTFELEFEQMRWVKSTLALKDDAFFVKIFKFDFCTNLELWMDPCQQYERIDTAENDNTLIHFSEDMWYYPHECLDVNLLHE